MSFGFGLSGSGGTGDGGAGAGQAILDELEARDYGTSTEDIRAYATTAASVGAAAGCAALGAAPAAPVCAGIGAAVGGVIFDAVVALFGNAEREAALERERERWAAYNSARKNVTAISAGLRIGTAQALADVVRAHWGRLEHRVIPWGWHGPVAGDGWPPPADKVTWGLAVGRYLTMPPESERLAWAERWSWGLNPQGKAAYDRLAAVLWNVCSSPDGSCGPQLRDSCVRMGAMTDANDAGMRRCVARWAEALGVAQSELVDGLASTLGVVLAQGQEPPTLAMRGIQIMIDDNKRGAARVAIGGLTIAALAGASAYGWSRYVTL